MAKGLDLLLNKIRAEPTPTLISRYLSLVEDLPDGRDKTSCVLELASLLTRSQPDEALRLAHQVYRVDPHQLGALDIMADAFTAKGRYAKAAVIQLEKEKLERRKGSPSPLPSPSLEKSGSPAPSAGERPMIGLVGMEVDFDLESQVSLSHEESPVVTALGTNAVQERHESHGERHGTAVARGPGPQFSLMGVVEDLSGVEGGPPKPTMLVPPPAPSAQGDLPERGSGLSHELSPQEPDHPRKTPPGGLSRRLLRRLIGKEPGDTVLPFPATPDASTTAESLASGPSQAPEEPLPGWAEQSPVGRASVSSALAGTPAAKAPPLWLQLGEQFARLRSRLPLRYLDPSGAARIKMLLATHPSGATLPDDFIRALGELDHRLKGTDPVEVLALKWELFQGLWGGEPTGACADLLKTLGLRHATPAFWGLYLDSLIADQRFQAALQDMRITLKNHPHLNWARIVAFRLPIVWQGLKVHGFAWSEDDGVVALINALKERPKPKIGAILGHAFSSKKAGP